MNVYHISTLAALLAVPTVGVSQAYASGSIVQLLRGYINAVDSLTRTMENTTDDNFSNLQKEFRLSIQRLKELNAEAEKLTLADYADPQIQADAAAALEEFSVSTQLYQLTLIEMLPRLSKENMRIVAELLKEFGMELCRGGDAFQNSALGGGR